MKQFHFLLLFLLVSPILAGDLSSLFSFQKQYGLQNGFMGNVARGCADSFDREAANSIADQFVELLKDNGCTVTGEIVYERRTMGPDFYRVMVNGQCPSDLKADLKLDSSMRDVNCHFYAEISKGSVKRRSLFAY